MNNNLLIIWSERHESGIPIIDEQHRTIAALMNSLWFMISQNQFLDSIVPLATALVHHNKIHNFTEEYLFSISGYEDSENHCIAHRENEIELHNVIRKSLQVNEKNNIAVANDIMSYMKKYWLGHICVEDKKYISFLRKTLDPEQYVTEAITRR